MDFTFDLSQGLFSSAEIDRGSQSLLKVFSNIIDEAGKTASMSVLDAGCGVGVIGICAAAAIRALGGAVQVRSQDRDELARLFTLHNAEKNGISKEILQAHTEPLLSGSANSRHDMILCNIPAKAGRPVLEDFVSRSVKLLNPDGKIIIVAVNTLADFFREQIKVCGTELDREEKSAGYSVFVYGGNPQTVSVPVTEGSFLESCPFYKRNTVKYLFEDIPMTIETVHGAPGFDGPGGAAEAAAKLLRRIVAQRPNLPHNEKVPVLIHEPGQGFFPCWLLEFLRLEHEALVLSGRNILVLEAVRHNIKKNADCKNLPLIVPAVDLRLGANDLLKAAHSMGSEQFGIIAAFPEFIPSSLLPKGTDQLTELWDSLPPLLAKGGFFIAGLSSANAERFDRIKPAGFNRLGDIKRKGFRALAYSLLHHEI